MEQDLKRLYYNVDSMGSYGGIKRLRYVSRKRNVTKWLSGERTYTLHRPARRRMSKYRSYKAPKFGYQFQADLNDMIKLSKFNKGYKYIMTVIDVFSRYAWAFSLKSKTGKEITETFKKIGVKPIFLQTDQGTEFYNAIFKKYLGASKLFSVYSPQKAAMVERFNRTLKTKMYRYFTYHNTQNWVAILPKLMNTYNNTPHSSLPKKLSPNEARKNTNWWLVWDHSHKNVIPKIQKLKVGDTVRISKTKRTFEKGYVSNWSEQIFKINHIDRRDDPEMYVVIDYRGEVIDGKFYRQELQKIIPPKLYPIEKVYKKTTKKSLVKFLGYPEKYWVKNIESSL